MYINFVQIYISKIRHLLSELYFGFFQTFEGLEETEIQLLIYISLNMKIMCPPGYHHNSFVATHAVGHMSPSIICPSA